MCCSRPTVRSVCRRTPNTWYRAGQHVERRRAVEVEEVDVGDRALQHTFGEGEHEALLHRRAGRAVQAAHRQRDHDRDAQRGPPRPERSEPEAPAHHERGRVVARLRDHRRSQSSSDGRCKWNDPDAGEHAQHELGRSPEPRRRVRVGSGERDGEQLGDEGDQGDPAAAYEHRRRRSRTAPSPRTSGTRAAPPVRCGPRSVRTRCSATAGTGPTGGGRARRAPWAAPTCGRARTRCPGRASTTSSPTRRRADRPAGPGRCVPRACASGTRSPRSRGTCRCRPCRSSRTRAARCRWC